MSLIFSAGSFLVSLDNRRQLPLIKNRENAQTEKLDNLFHIVEHEHDILQRFDDKIPKIRSIMSEKFNLYRLKFFEVEALIYINSLYKDLDNAISKRKTPSPWLTHLKSKTTSPVSQSTSRPMVTFSTKVQMSFLQ